jgi:hypothetical protein
MRSVHDEVERSPFRVNSSSLGAALALVGACESMSERAQNRCVAIFLAEQSA